MYSLLIPVLLITQCLKSEMCHGRVSHFQHFPLTVTSANLVIPPDSVSPAGMADFRCGYADHAGSGCGRSVELLKVAPQPLSPVPAIVDAHVLTTLAQLPPLWRQVYGFVLAARAGSVQTETLKAQWQQHLMGNAHPQNHYPAGIRGWKIAGTDIPPEYA